PMRTAPCARSSNAIRSAFRLNMPPISSNGGPRLFISIRRTRKGETPARGSQMENRIAANRDPEPMSTSKIASRLAAVVLAFGLAAPVGARAEGDIYVHAGPNFKPVTIAVTPLAGDDGSTK